MIKIGFLHAGFVRLALGLAPVTAAFATQTEHVSFRALPAPRSIVIDAKSGDWDLSGGIFACEDVEQQRDSFGVWLHAQYDADNFYLLARFVDATPMNHPGQTIADYGFAGDSLQFRTLTGQGGNERVEHFTAWRGRDRADVIKVEHGRTFANGFTADAKKSDGARQAFAINSDGKGYVQEIAIPWKLITRDGASLKAGAAFTLTFEPNFTIGGTGRLTVKDLFRPGGKLDRVFTFTNAELWGPVTLEKQGKVAPQPLRLADGRTFPVTLRDGVPVVDWSGLETAVQDEGVVPIAFELERDSYVSLNLKNAQGQVVRQLLNTAFFKKGRHEVKWDGAATPSWTRPGDFLAPGDYTWSALTHTGLGLKLRGWAANGGVAPWDSPDGRGNWGGDHGVPVAVTADDARVYLGWSGAEAGRAVVACDLQGRPLWGNNRSGIAGVKGLAVADNVLYVLGGAAGPDAEGGNLYKLDARNGAYVTWENGAADVKVAALWPNDASVKPAQADAVAVAEGRIFLSFTAANVIAVVDGKSGRLLRTLAANAPGALGVRAGRLYALAGTDRLVTFGAADNPGAAETVGTDVPTVAFALGPKTIFRASGDPVNQIAVYPDGAASSAPTTALGVRGGRALLGAWQPDGVRFVRSMAVDAEDKLWVVEADDTPKRISVWNPRTGKLVREFFGPTNYGALGGAISPLDPDVMVGHGGEWRIDPQTGFARLTTVITRDGMQNSRFAVGSNGRLYLAVASGWIPTSPKVSFFERVGDAAYKLRSAFRYEGKDASAQTVYWADENGDEQEQPGEVTRVSGHKNFSGWYMSLAPDLSIYAAGERFKVAGFTACGAPRYDLSKPERMPFEGGLGSADGRWLARGGNYGEAHTQFAMVDLATGQTRWTYPDNFNGVHGSHHAPPAAVGLVRGSFGLTGTAKLPAPIGNVWATATNVGEWHLLTEEGFYLGKLFEADPMKVRWPARAVPGADMTHTPPGMGGEDFGGTIASSKDGKLYVQAGKTAYWNLEVTGLDTVRTLPGGKVTLSGPALVAARRARETRVQAAVGPRTLRVKPATPTLNGRFDSDFGDAQMAEFNKGDSGDGRFAAGFDDTTLFLQWNVRDQTPWVNGAQAEEQMYVGGDTVDFQLGADPSADTNREKPVLGDWRLSIGNFKGKPTAVLYRPLANGDRPRTPRSFSSGVVKDYVVADVRVLPDVALKVEKRGDGYIVQAAVPWRALEMTAPAGRSLRGDFGVTYGDAAGQRTRLRSYWSNQHTGLVDDVVFELMLEPRYWGEITFQ